MTFDHDDVLSNYLNNQLSLNIILETLSVNPVIQFACSAYVLLNTQFGSYFFYHYTILLTVT